MQNYNKNLEYASFRAFFLQIEQKFYIFYAKNSGYARSLRSFFMFIAFEGFYLFFLFIIFYPPSLCISRASLREPQNTPKAAVKLPLMIYWFFLSSSLFTAYFLKRQLICCLQFQLLTICKHLTACILPSVEANWWGVQIVPHTEFSSASR